jgi:hypothetical protein
MKVKLADSVVAVPVKWLADAEHEIFKRRWDGLFPSWTRLDRGCWTVQ